jgi:tRNA pseudouridine55 synthase
MLPMSRLARGVRGGSAGVVVFPKPPGVTSHDVVAGVRRRLGTRVGHAGTLDPFATGVLLVLVGPATRVQRFLMPLPKTYRVVARLGWTSDTGDREGALEHTGRVPGELRLPTGELLQRPPAYSAVRVRGERAYRRARRGETVTTEARPVTVHRFELLWRTGERVGLEIECSAGTYVRQLVAELGDAYCEELERTAVGPFRLEHADPERLLPLNEALAFMPERRLDAEEVRRVAHGQRLPAAPAGAGAKPAGERAKSAGERAGPVRLTAGGELVAIGEPRAGGLQPVVVFRPG